MTRHPSVMAPVGLVVMAFVLVVTAASSVAAPILPPLRFAVVVTEVRRGRCDGVLAELHSLSEKPGPTGGRASYLLAHCLLQQGDVVAARREFDQVAEGAGDRTLAIRAYAMAWWSVPEAAGADAAYGRLRDLQPDRTPMPPADARLQRATRLVAAGEFVLAERELADALHQPLPPEMAADAWYRLGILRLRTQGAAYAFEQSASIPGEHRPPALYWFGRALALDDHDGEALAIWRRLVDEEPESAWAARAMVSLAALTELHGNLPGAQQWLRRAAQRYPDSPAADDARWRLGWVMFRQGRIHDAEQQFLDSATRFPATPRAAANLYWAAKARARRGADARGLLIEVARAYPLTFYGWRARELTGVPEPVLQSAPPAVRLGDDRAWPAFEELAALGFDDDAVELVETHLDTTTDVPVLQTAAWLWGRMDIYHRSVAAAERAILPAMREGALADRELWTLAYPLAYWDDLRRAAQEQRVDPFLVLAVMREESRYNPRVVSLAGAVGLTQLLPSTASAGGGAGIEHSPVSEPPAQNLMIPRQPLGVEAL